LTVSVAVAVLPAPPSLEVTAEVVLENVPAAAAVTLTKNVQELLAAIVAFDKLAEPDPAVAVMVPPPHDPVRPLGVEITKPDGSVSVNPTPVSEVEALGLVMVNDSELEPPTAIDVGVNASVMLGGATTTVVTLEALLLGLGSKVPLVTEAKLFCVPMPNLLKVPVIVIVEAEAPLARLDNVHSTFCPGDEQDQPAPLAEVPLYPKGKMSEIVGFDALSGPALCTVS
jgi:hypothetical protein